MTISWHPQYTAPDVDELGRLFASFSYKDNGKRVGLPVKYSSQPLVVAKDLLNYIRPYTGMEIGSITAIVEQNSVTTRPEDPGNEPPGVTFRFKAKRAGVMYEDDLSFHVPCFLSENDDQVQLVGEYIAEHVLTEGTNLIVRFVGIAGGRR